MRPDLHALISPVTYLIRGAIFRRKHRGDELSEPDRFSLSIRPLSELVDMYHTHNATFLPDKVYALLGMSNDNPYKAGLGPDYKAAWRDVFQKLIRFCLSDRMSVSTWDRVEAAVIEVRGCVLGEVSSVGEDTALHDRQYVEITWKSVPRYFDMEGKQSSHITFQASAKAVKKGDVVCLLQGASRPIIIRLCGGFSTIIMTAPPLTDDLQKWSALVTIFPTDLLLLWDWDKSQRESQGGEDYEKLISSREVPKCSVAGCQCLHDMDRAARLWNFGLLLNRMERYKEAAQNIQKALEVYKSREGLGSMEKTYLGHGSWREVDKEVLEIMEDLVISGKSVNIEAKYTEHNQTPLSWAAENGHEAIVRLLVKKDADIEAKDNSYGRTPLSWAAENGHEAVVRLLVEKGADIEAKDNSYGQTPLFWAAENGHEAVVRLLVEKGTNIEAKNRFSQTLLLCAAENGHEAVVRLLVEKGADIEGKNGSYDRTPLLWAAENGHKAFVRLLVEKGANIEAKKDFFQTPLLLAAENGHEAVVRLLVEKGADIEVKDGFYGRTPLLLAAQNGHGAIVRLLVENGADIEAKNADSYGRTPLLWAAENGNDTIVRLLVEKGADIEGKDDFYGWTLLLWAAKNGHKAIVRLLVEKGANIEAKDMIYGQTPLLWATKYGHEAVIRLLVEKGADIEAKDNSYSRTPLSWAAENGHEAVVQLLAAAGREGRRYRGKG